MKLRSQSIGVAAGQQAAKMYAQIPALAKGLHHMGIRSIGAAGMILPPLVQLHSGLAGGIGIVTLYKVLGVAPGPIDTLNVYRVAGARPVTVDAEKVRLLERFAGNIADDSLYLLEYPGGYMLSLNNNFLAFTL